jgi:phospholipid/cholesterol/gamma-HCH transport system substrate-binding protein
MARSPVRDLMVGLFVLLGIGAIAYLSLQVGGLTYKGAGGLALYAKFDQIAGLKVRAPVEISGVKVGQVTTIGLSDDNRARVGLDVDAALKLPIDTSASIVTAGLLGDRYIALQPGGDTELLRPGDEISFTESAVILERLIGKLVHGGNGVGGKTPEGEEAQ